MPITNCQENGKPGLKWGEKGACYTYTPNNEISRNNAKKKVIKQAIAIGDYNMSGLKVSFDFDDTLTTKKGLELLRKELGEDNTIYIISARDNKMGMLNLAQRYNIAQSRVFATGSNQNKVDKLKELNIVRHYDNSQQVIDLAKEKEGLKTEIIKV